MEGSQSMDNKELMSFGEIWYDLVIVPRATRSHRLSEITKILYFEEKDMQQVDQIVIDLGDSVLFTEPTIDIDLDSSEADYNLSAEEIKSVLNMIEKYEVLAWKGHYGEKYGSEVSDGGGWNLIIQFDDGTINFVTGNDTSEEKNTPEGHKDFIEDMVKFINSKEPNQ